MDFGHRDQGLPGCPVLAGQPGHGCTSRSGRRNKTRWLGHDARTLQRDTEEH